MPYATGLDPQVSLWRKSKQSIDVIRISSNKEVYACSQIKYTNRLYWQGEIEKQILLRNNASDVMGSVNGNVAKGKKHEVVRMSVDSFHEKHLSKDIETQEQLLKHAISVGQNDFLNILIESGTDVNKIIEIEKKRTMLHLAVLNTDILRVKYLLLHGADVHSRDYEVNNHNYYKNSTHDF